MSNKQSEHPFLLLLLLLRFNVLLPPVVVVVVVVVAVVNYHQVRFIRVFFTNINLQFDNQNGDAAIISHPHGSILLLLLLLLTVKRCEKASARSMRGGGGV